MVVLKKLLCLEKARNLKQFGQKRSNDPLKTLLVAVVALAICSSPAIAHHPFGGETPSNFLTGFLSGLGHPVIGVDHFVFVIAIGLMAALKRVNGIFIPLAFIVATLLGTGIHLMNLDLPLPEMVISASVLCFGLMLAGKDRPTLAWILLVSAIAGIFHGYAYGEAIIGAEMSPLVGYLAGFAVIQAAIALGAFQIGRRLLDKEQSNPTLLLRFAGFIIIGAGLAFLSSAILG